MPRLNGECAGVIVLPVVNFNAMDYVIVMHSDLTGQFVLFSGDRVASNLICDGCTSHS
jgi:hypothetical protein